MHTCMAGCLLLAAHERPCLPTLVGVARSAHKKKNTECREKECFSQSEDYFVVAIIIECHQIRIAFSFLFMIHTQPTTYVRNTSIATLLANSIGCSLYKMCRISTKRTIGSKLHKQFQLIVRIIYKRVIRVIITTYIIL